MGVGKFEGLCKHDAAIAEELYGEAPDDEMGSSQDLGWYGLYGRERAILFEDTQGFVSIEFYEDDELLAAAWSTYLEAYTDWYDESE